MSLFQVPDPTTKNYAMRFDLLCGCQPPERCTCQRAAADITAPFDFAKLHGCLPDYCKCAGRNEPIKAPPVDLYLYPLKKVVDNHFGVNVKIVRLG